MVAVFLCQTGLQALLSPIKTATWTTGTTRVRARGLLTLTAELNPYAKTKFAILGGGAFSLALAQVLSYKNISTSLLVRRQDVADQINTNRFHPKYLSDCRLPDSLWATSDPVKALEGANFVVHAVPMQESRAFLEKVREHLPKDAPVLSVTKGVEQNTFCLMNDIILETLGTTRRAAFLSGPSFAREIMRGEATAVVIASTDDSLSSELSEILSGVEFRCHTSRDVKGVELGGAIKNVIALAAGMCEGLGLGMNAMSSLVTRGCMEMARCVSLFESFFSVLGPPSHFLPSPLSLFFSLSSLSLRPNRMGALFGADEETFFGLAGVGDTFGTCLGPLSRNRQVGIRLAKGERLEEILKSIDGVSEGVFTALALEQLIKTKVRPTVFDFKFPIISGVASIIKGTITPEFGLTLLMKYPVRDENRGNRRL